MYPNIVRAWNFGRGTFVGEGDVERDGDGWAASGGEHEGRRVIRGEAGGFVHPDDGPRSIPAETADELVGMREGADEAVDKGVKAVNNTLYGVFAADFYRYFGPHSENITLIGQELTGIIEDIAGGGHPDIERVVYGDTDSIMVSMDDPADRASAARRIADDVEREMRGWAAERGADASYLELDVDDIYSRFYIGDKKKRYFGRRVWKDGGPADDLKIRGFEARKGDWPEPMRDLQVELMEAVLGGEPTQPVVDRARGELFEGRWDRDLAVATTLTKPIDEYVSYPPHVRAAEMKRSDRGHAAAAVGDKVEYVKYGDDTGDVVHYLDGEPARDWRPNEGYCPECGEVVRTDGGGHPHGTEAYPFFRTGHYRFIWENRAINVAESIGVPTVRTATLGDFA